MDMENQKFMAFEGIQSWARSVVRQVERINSIQARFATREHFVDSRRQFACERHLFLIAAYKLIEYIDWAKNLEFLNEGLFVEIENFRKDFKDMRDLNEHAVEYFIGPGKFPHKWFHTDEGAIADASSTINDRIGNRLSWNEVAAATQRLLIQMPTQYSYKRINQ